MHPVSNVHGFDRGTPIDRFYIAIFLSECADMIVGNVAEMKDARYATQFGSSQITSVDVIDIEPANARATLIADLVRPGSLPAASFDSIIVTQTIQFLSNPSAAIRNLWTALRPGGVLLLTAPTVGRLSVSIPEVDYWRVTPPGLRRLFSNWDGTVTYRDFGNLRTSLAMLLGEASEELSNDELLEYQPAFPLLTAAAAHRALEV